VKSRPLAVFERDGDELADPGLFVDLAPWHSTCSPCPQG